MPEAYSAWIFEVSKEVTELPYTWLSLAAVWWFVEPFSFLSDDLQVPALCGKRRPISLSFGLEIRGPLFWK